MIYIEKVYGGAEQAQPLVVAPDKVYIHKNIVKIETDNEGNPIEDMYQYEEYQYEYHEYIYMLSQENKSLADSNQQLMLAVAELGTMVSPVKEV